jgi:thiol-disulfide isomerase/thioredoxin
MGCLFSAFFVAPVPAATPTAEQALQLLPVQKGVEIAEPLPEEVEKCRITPRKASGEVGWIVEDPAGVVLRAFLDTNNDNVVDQWSYFKGGLEVYRDVDRNFNGKADQFCWYHTGGSRVGLDQDENGIIDAWKSISAEEVSAEVVAALASRDAAQFQRLVLTETELKSLGVAANKLKELSEKLTGLPKKFQQMASQQKLVTTSTRWIQFSGGRPGIVPAGTDGSTKDLLVYENVVAIVQTGDQHGQVVVGTLIQVGNVWRLIDLPVLVGDAESQVAESGFFFKSPLVDQGQTLSAGSDEASRELLTKLEQYDAAINRAATPQESARLNGQRANLLMELASKAKTTNDRSMWVRQFADVVSTAVQSGGYPDGVKQLEALYKQLAKSKEDQDLAGYVKFRQMTAGYFLSLNVDNPPADYFVKVQTDWLQQLEQYTKDYPKSPDTAEAMLQLANAQEFAGNEEAANGWYERIVKEFPDAPCAKKAGGARARLGSVGKTLNLQGKSASGGTVDLSKYRGHVVLIQYWATWCEPCKADMPTLKDLVSRYGRSGFDIIGVNLDGSPETMAGYVKEYGLSWPQIHEQGGLDSRPANDLGILTLPTMILVDQQGKVVNRNINVAELDPTLKKLIR